MRFLCPFIHAYIFQITVLARRVHSLADRPSKSDEPMIYICPVFSVGLLHQHAQRVAMAVGAVVAADDGNIANGGHGVAQQRDVGITVETLHLAGSVIVGIIFVVTHAGVDGHLQLAEPLGHVLVLQGPQRAVHEVAGHEQHVATLAVEHRHPAVEVGAAVVVA